MRESVFYRSNITLKDKVLSLDYILLFSVLILGIISFFAMYSTESGNLNYYTKSHIFRFCIFFLLFVVISFFNIKIWHKTAFLFYFFVMLLLIGVDYFGITSSGSKRWINLFIFNLQPSELMKVAIIIFLARYYNKIPAASVNNIKFIFLPILVLILPVGMVLGQPDLGTATLIALTGASVIWLAGFRIKYLAFLSAIFICLAPIIISFLKPYQKSRILTFLNPERDPLGAGYQIIQSKIAVGSGGIFGKGFLQGSQSYLDYLPEKHTDFIFTLYAEQFGFFGSVALLALYVLIIYRTIRIGTLSKNNFSRLYCYGFAASFFIYVAVNMAMVLGLLPIVGAPLPIMSYGGSAMLSMMLGLGIVMSCKVYNQESVI